MVDVGVHTHGHGLHDFPVNGRIATTAPFSMASCKESRLKSSFVITKKAIKELPFSIVILKNLETIPPDQMINIFTLKPRELQPWMMTMGK